ncbi:flagellar protein FlaG [Halarsenatibacter silvermanii]|uniref:FlaG protein n=1 Tax=Halarsenatibacter silvermanii TaxID=321763 RepID=A0A1G9M2D6_9FIRM|nr:flagellar protein FlaG [Halarsenatibacter silvermanii]SDL67865.1 FlaG protein [Halarsenatibacter silvermanii]
MRVESTSNTEAVREASSNPQQREAQDTQDAPQSPESPDAADAPTAEDLTETREQEAPVELEIDGVEPRRRLREDRLDRDLDDLVADYLEGELDRLNDFVRAFDKRFDFQIHEESNDYFIQVWDIVEDELIREIPPEDVLDLAARLDEMIGIIFDERR